MAKGMRGNLGWKRHAGIEQAQLLTERLTVAPSGNRSLKFMG
jgi:hypothetical protein